MKFQILFILTSFILANAQEDNQYHCPKELNLTAFEYRQYATLKPLGVWIEIFGGITAIVLNSFLLIVFKVYPTARKAPADIIIVICISGVLSGIHSLLIGTYVAIHGIAPVGQDINIYQQARWFNRSYLFIWLISFWARVCVFSKRDNKSHIEKQMEKIRVKMNSYTSIMVYLATFSIIIMIVILALCYNRIDLTIHGECFLQSTSKNGSLLSELFDVTVTVAFICVASLSIMSLKKAVPKNPRTLAKRLSYIRYFQTYFVVTLSIDLLVDILIAIFFQDCNVVILEQLNDFTLLILQCPAIVRPIIFMFDPRLQGAIKHMVGIVLRRSASELKETLLNQEDDILSELTNQMRTSQVYSCLAGILLLDKSYMVSQNGSNVQKTDSLDQIESRQSAFDEDSLSKQQDIKKFNDDDLKESAIVMMDDFLVKTCLNAIDDISVFDMKITLFAPKIFYFFQQVDYPLINLQQSFDLIQNKDGIEQFNSGPDGGKSGEFFFFSNDNKLILKSLSQEELTSIKKRLVHYGNYLFNNQDSLIAKIYGIYSFQRVINHAPQGTKTHLLLMRNVSLGIPKQYIKRTFDLKGSEYDREIIGSKVNQDLTKLTLKDFDFFKTEDKVWVPQTLQKYIYEILKKDSKFFQYVKLIDYSLLLLKVDMKQYQQDTGISAQDLAFILPNILYLVKSTNQDEDGIYYQMAIIDYLQEWNVNKVLEQSTKKLIKLDSQLDTSAQNPTIYSHRFCTKLLSRIFDQKPEVEDNYKKSLVIN